MAMLKFVITMTIVMRAVFMMVFLLRPGKLRGVQIMVQLSRVVKKRSQVFLRLAHLLGECVRFCCHMLKNDEIKNVVFTTA